VESLIGASIDKARYSKSQWKEVTQKLKKGETKQVIDGDHGDRFLNEFNEFIQKPVPMIIPCLAFYLRAFCVNSPKLLSKVKLFS